MTAQRYCTRNTWKSSRRGVRAVSYQHLSRQPKAKKLTAEMLTALRDVGSLFFLVLGPAEARDLGLQFAARPEHQSEPLGFGQMAAVVVLQDASLGGRVDAGSTAVATEFGEPLVFSGEVEDRVQVGCDGLVARSSGDGGVEQFPVQTVEVRHPQHVSPDLESARALVGYDFEASASYTLGDAEDHGGGRQGYLGKVAVHAAQLQRSLAVEPDRVPGGS